MVSMSIVINGGELASKINAKVKERVEELKRRGVYPCITAVLVGNDEASTIYVREKIKQCEKAGIKAQLLHLPQDMDTESLIKEINKLCLDKTVHAILVQLPLPRQIDENAVLEGISPEKDVDCLNPLNLGRLLVNDDCIESCTPKGIIRILENFNIPLEGKNVVVVNRSKIIGKPLSLMLLKKNATVRICHSKTEKLADHLSRADIIIVGVGKPKFLTGDMIKSGAVIIDVGTNKVNNKVVGDVDFESVKEKASYITPVPGGVGPMTVAMVLENTVLLAERFGGAND